MKSISALLLALLFINFSCKKAEAPIFDHCGPPPKVLMKVTGLTSLGGDGSVRPVDMKIIYEPESSRINKITDGKKLMELLWENIYLYKIVYSDSSTSIPTRRVQQLVDASGTKPIAQTESEYQGDQLVSESKNNYVYTENSITKSRLLSDNTTIIEKYIYEKGNIISYDNGQGTIFNYRYNDKLNPFAVEWLKFQMGPIDFLSLNSVIEIEKIENGIKTVNKITYTYGPDGLPLTARSINSNGTVGFDYKFEYGTLRLPCY